MQSQGCVTGLSQHCSIIVSLDHTKVAVLHMADRSTPGGGVRRGAGAHEGEMCRRTDLLRHTARYAQQKERYPLEVEEESAMMHEGVTIIRGPNADGYPFLHNGT